LSYRTSTQSAAALRYDPGEQVRLTTASCSLAGRILWLALLFAAELIVITISVDTASLKRSAGLTGMIRDWGPWVLRAVAGFGAIFVTFAYLKNRSALEQMSRRLGEAPVRWNLLAAHGLAMAVFAGLSFQLYGRSTAGPSADLLAAGWVAAGVWAIALAGLAFLPRTIWAHVLRVTGYLWAYALVAVVAGCVIGSTARFLWQPASRLTLGLAKFFLSPFVSDVVANPATMSLGARHFYVYIAPQCSGLEGAGLVLGFGVLWLSLFRDECRFPQALILLPAGVVVIFLLNAVRLAALVLVGIAGGRQIAVGGFHSQAGWILFNVVAVSFTLAVRRVPWFTTGAGNIESHPYARERAAENPTADYLAPFLAILAAGMISSAASGGFEWFYPLRLFAAAGALWIFRRSYRALDWNFDWVAPTLGVLVFVIWIAMDRFSNPMANPGLSSALPSELAASSEGVRVTWILLRALAAVVTVPIAEELAFRGFLLRRLLSADFESVSFQRVKWWALAASSVAFGFMHRERWAAGILAGAVFGLLAMRRGRMGDAVAAHATANALLAAYILTYNRWQFW